MRPEFKNELRRIQETAAEAKKQKRISELAPEAIVALRAVWNDIQGKMPSSYVKLPTFDLVKSVIEKLDKGERE